MKGEIDAFLELLKFEGMRKNSIDAYGRDIRQMAEWLQNKGCNQWAQLDQEMITLYIGELESSGKSQSTVARQSASKRRFIRYLNEIGCQIDTTTIKRPKCSSCRKPFLILSKEQIQHLFNTPDLKSKSGLRDYLMLRMLYETGIKVTEIIGLTLSDVDFKRRRILCKSPYEQRVIYLNQDINKHLKKYLALRAVDYSDASTPIFANCYNQCISRQGLWKLVKNYAELLGYDSAVTPHTLRHSFAVHLLQEGGTLRHLQMVMGHQDVSSTQVYDDYVSAITAIQAT